MKYNLQAFNTAAIKCVPFFVDGVREVGIQLCPFLSFVLLLYWMTRCGYGYMDTHTWSEVG